jgi:hypothetical protein
MAKTDFPLTIDRRRLLVSAAAVTSACILPGAEGADGTASGLSQSSPLRPKSESANFRRNR